MKPTTVRSEFKGANFTTKIISDQHELIADERIDLGGQNKGFDPFELILAALATCTTATIKMYVDRKEWELKAIDIQLSMEKRENMQHIQTTIEVASALTEKELERLLLIAKKCPVHKILAQGNLIETTLRAASSS